MRFPRPLLQEMKSIWRCLLSSPYQMRLKRLMRANLNALESSLNETWPTAGGLFIALSPKRLTCDNGCDKPAMNKPPGKRVPSNNTRCSLEGGNRHDVR